MKKIHIIYMMISLLLGITVTSCDGEEAMPPVPVPEGGIESIGTGAWDKPMSAYQAMIGSETTDGSAAWVRGYIVGYINTGVSNVLSAESAALQPEKCSVNTNLLIAMSPDETDWKKCATVQLPSGAARNALNLRDHIDNLGKEVCLLGTVGSKYCGSYGIRDVSSYNFGATGLETKPGNDDNKGTGAWDSPFTVAQAQAGETNPSLSEVWVCGYIVGCCDTGVQTFLCAESAVMQPESTTVITNILMADKPDETNWEKCVTVQLPSGDVRVALNLCDNPDNLRKQVCVRGVTGSNYCGVPGVRTVTAYNWGNKGLQSGDSGQESVVYSGLDPDASEIDWTYENITLGDGLSYVWSWKDYNGKHYLNGSAFSSNSARESLSYAVSPVIDLTGKISAHASFEHAAKFQTTLRDLCGFAVREEGSDQWTEYAIPTWPTAGSWTFVNSGSIDLKAFAGKKIRVAMKYGSSTAGADTWEIHSLKVTAK